MCLRVPILLWFVRVRVRVKFEPTVMLLELGNYPASGIDLMILGWKNSFKLLLLLVAVVVCFVGSSGAPSGGLAEHSRMFFSFVRSQRMTKSPDTDINTNTNTNHAFSFHPNNTWSGIGTKFGTGIGTGIGTGTEITETESSRLQLPSS